MPGLESQVDLDKLIRQYDEATDPLHGSEERVQEVVDALDEALEETQDLGALYRQGVRQLCTWCSSKSGCLPSSCRIPVTIELEPPGHPLSQGALWDNYSGQSAGRLVMVKVLRMQGHDQEVVQMSFRNEVVIWKWLRHPNIVPFKFLGVSNYFLGISNYFPVCLVSEWMPEGTVSSFFDAHPDENRLPYIQQILSGLDFLHTLGVVHGDLKPYHILVDGGHNARLSGFGMSTILYITPSQLAEACNIPAGGTIGFMAPELFSPWLKRTGLNVQSDIYALTITLWQLFAQQYPYSDIPYHSVVAMVSAGTRPSRPSASADIGFTDKIWVIIQRGWAHEPADRPALVEFLEVIESEITHRRKLAMDGRQGPLDAQKRMLNTEEKVSDTVATERLLPASKSATTSAAAPTFESPPVSAPLSIPGASSSMPLPARSPGTMSPHADEELASALSTYLARLDRQYREGIAAPYDSDERVQEVIDGLDKALNDMHASGSLYAWGVQRLRRWCRKSGRLPSSCTIVKSIELETPGRPLSSSRLSDVYRGVSSGTSVAVKALRVHMDNQEAVQKAFSNEVVTWKCLRHPNIVPFLGISDCFPVCIVSEWMPKGTIFGFFMAHPDKNRLPYIMQIVRGLDFMHTLDVIHGDLKSANILIDQEHNARLTDFGMTTVLVNTSTQLDSDNGEPGGTLRFMAPELLSEGAQLNVRTDIYALAITLWELFARDIPYPLIRRDPVVVVRVLEGERPTRPGTSANVGLTDEVWDVMQRGWDKEPQYRPGLAEFLQAVAPDIVRLCRPELDARQGLLDTREHELDAREEALRTVDAELRLREAAVRSKEEEVQRRKTALDATSMQAGKRGEIAAAVRLWNRHGEAKVTHSRRENMVTYGDPEVLWLHMKRELNQRKKSARVDTEDQNALKQKCVHQ